MTDTEITSKITPEHVGRNIHWYDSTYGRIDAVIEVVRESDCFCDVRAMCDGVPGSLVRVDRDGAGSSWTWT